MTTDQAYETAMELLELETLLRESGEADRQQEADEAHRQAVAIRDEYFPSGDPTRQARGVCSFPSGGPTAGPRILASFR